MKDLIVKSNALIEAGHRLSLAEQRIVLSAITQIRRDEQPSSEQWYTVTANALADVAGITAHRAYQELQEAAESLYERKIVIRGGPNGDDNGPDGEEITYTRWVQAVRYIRGQGAVRLMFSALVVPYLSALKEQFTQYELRHVAPMRSRFGPRLYELLVQWRSQGEREVSVGDLQRMWEAPYDRIYDFKRWVITPAVADVNKHSDLHVTVGYRKTGRNVTHVQFQFKPKAAKPAKAKAKLTDADIARLARPGESWEAARARLAPGVPSS